MSENLKDLRIVPLTNYLPLRGKSSLSLNDEAKDWAGNWYKFVGGQGTLKLEFIGEPSASFKVAYITQDVSGAFSVNFLELNGTKKAEVLIPNFKTEITSLTIIPVAQSVISGFYDDALSFSFFWSVSTIEQEPEPINPSKPISEMTANEIRAEIQKIQLQIIDLLRQMIVLLQE